MTRPRTPSQVPAWQALAIAAALSGVLALLIVLILTTGRTT